ncbi:MAG: SDR family NAD(P)-dependent oxidoreductase [Gemmatimonadaceae bacterium]|nr:SDR family NAD(P)-dependent oxidoreductase [Gemmatimonadaceae bacterium]
MTSPIDIQGRTFFVTGANSGIGRAAVEALVARGGSVVLAARSEARTLPVIDALRQRWPEADVHFVQLDLASLAAVRDAVERFLATGRPVDVLINNAGMAGASGLSVDGYEIAFATNHLGPYLLTELLLPRLREAPQGRIVNVSSDAHRIVKQIDWSLLDHPVPRRRTFAQYGLTKLMNVLHAKELARRLAGTRATTYAVHPGAVASNVWRELPRAVQWVIKLVTISNEEGARTPVYCATAPELSASSGRYYERCREVAPSPLAEDESLARELFARSDAMIRRALGQ